MDYTVHANQPTEEQELDGLSPTEVSHIPVEYVIIFSTPAPILIREAINLQKLCLA